MQTIEVLFANRRKEQLTADAISLTDAPGWVVLKTAGSVVEMISATVIKRLKVIRSEPVERAVPTPSPDIHSVPRTPLLRLPTRQANGQIAARF